MTRLRCKRGATLVELLVVLAVLGLIMGTVGLVTRRADPESTHDPASQLAAARRDALASGRAVRLTFVTEGRVGEATAWPDGSVHCDTILAIERLSGRRRAAR